MKKIVNILKLKSTKNLVFDDFLTFLALERRPE